MQTMSLVSHKGRYRKASVLRIVSNATKISFVHAYRKRVITYWIVNLLRHMLSVEFTIYHRFFV